MQKQKFFVLLLFAIVIVLSGSTIYLALDTDEVIYAEQLSDETNATRTSHTNSIYTERRNIITETVSDVSHAVVGINVTEIRRYHDPFDPFYNDPFFQQFFGYRSYNREVKSLGSGFIISPDGYIITNDHVAGNAVETVVTLTNGDHLNAKLVGTDPVSDICLLKVDAENLPYLKLGNSDDIIIGEWVIALGNPFGLFDVNDKPTVTVGVISATGMNLDPVDNRFYLNMIQTDAAINGGNSGGPLVNSLGEVIGMNAVIFTAGQSQGSIGLGFAIPINKIKAIVQELKDSGEIIRDFYTGMAVQNLDEELATYFGLNTTKGVIITKIIRNSPAHKAELQPGDIIIRVGNYIISDEKMLLGVLQEYRTDDIINIEIIREDERFVTPMKLEQRQ